MNVKIPEQKKVKKIRNVNKGKPAVKYFAGFYDWKNHSGACLKTAWTWLVAACKVDRPGANFLKHALIHRKRGIDDEFCDKT